MSASGYIDPQDGFTERAYLVERPGLYSRVEFTFRPMLIEQLVAFSQASKPLQGMQLRNLVAGLLAAQLKSWDVKDRKGAVVPITTASLLRLKDPLFNRLWSVVSTDEAPDGVLDQDDAEAAAAAQDLLAAAQTGRSVAEVREERQRKNSSAPSAST